MLTFLRSRKIALRCHPCNNVFFVCVCVPLVKRDMCKTPGGLFPLCCALYKYGIIGARVRIALMLRIYSTNDERERMQRMILRTQIHRSKCSLNGEHNICVCALNVGGLCVVGWDDDGDDGGVWRIESTIGCAAIGVIVHECRIGYVEPRAQQIAGIYDGDCFEIYATCEIILFKIVWKSGITRTRVRIKVQQKNRNEHFYLKNNHLYHPCNQYKHLNMNLKQLKRGIQILEQMYGNIRIVYHNYWFPSSLS